jgi:hypothetical protein
MEWNQKMKMKNKDEEPKRAEIFVYGKSGGLSTCTEAVEDVLLLAGEHKSKRRLHITWILDRTPVLSSRVSVRLMDG